MQRSPFRTLAATIATGGLIALAITGSSASALVPPTTTAVDDVVDLIPVELGPAAWYDAGPLPGLGAGNNSQPDDDGCWTWDRHELGFLDKINEVRQQRSLGRVNIDPELSKVSAHHSYNMKMFDRLYHTPERKLRERVTKWSILGENVGTGADVESLFKEFMSSKPHREIILHDPFNFVGLGVGEQGGRMWVTLLFESRQDPGTTMEMRKAC